MKMNSIYLFALMLILTACTQNAVYTSTPTDTFIVVSDIATTIPTVTPITPTSIPETPFVTSVSVEGFSVPDPQTWVMLMPVVREYFYYRQKAIYSNDIEELWMRYPELKNEIDIERGVNAEEFLVTNYQGLKPFDGNFFPEHYERIRVKLENDKAEIYVHGIELFLYLDENENFQESGGEIKIILFVRKQNNRWVVYKTDRINLGEPNPFSP